MKESELFIPIKSYLEGQGYAVHSEVKNCDLVARKGDDILVVEIKLRFSLQLVLQGVQRQEASDSVYLAVPLTSARSYPGNFSGIKRLLRRLGLGLMFVRLMKTKTRVEIALQPSDPWKRNRPSREKAIIREIDGRYGEFNRAGETSRTEKFTAYRQLSLLIALCLSEQGSLSPAALKERGLPPKSGRILQQNFYGWFDRPQRGLYVLNEAGKLALERNRELAESVRAGFMDKQGTGE